MKGKIFTIYLRREDFRPLTDGLSPFDSILDDLGIRDQVFVDEIIVHTRPKRCSTFRKDGSLIQTLDLDTETKLADFSVDRRVKAAAPGSDYDFQVVRKNAPERE